MGEGLSSSTPEEEPLQFMTAEGKGMAGGRLLMLWWMIPHSQCGTSWTQWVKQNKTKEEDMKVGGGCVGDV